MTHKGPLFWIGFWMTLFLVTVAIVAVVPFPFVFVLALWIAALLTAANSTSANLAQLVCAVVAFVLAIALALEINWARKKTKLANMEVVLERSEDFKYRDPVIGVRLTPNHIEPAHKTVDGVLSYSVVYTMDQHGLRVTPELGTAADDSCLLFLGGSDTFGQGVEDEQTMPFIVSQLTQKKAFNLGVSGYGAHQMLALLQFDMLPKPLSCRPVVAIYQAHPDHVKRSAGLGQYGKAGPRYVVGEDGSAVYWGKFEDYQPFSFADSAWAKLFGKSYIFQEYLIDRDYIGQPEIELYLAVVEKAKVEVKKKFPGIRFVIMYSDTSVRTYAKHLARVLPEIADVYVADTDIIPDLNEAHDKYRLPRDPHPTPEAQRLIAEYVAEVLVP